MSKVLKAVPRHSRLQLPERLFGAQWWLRSGAALAFAAVFVGFAFTSPLFFTIANLANVLQQSVVVGILGFGLTMVLIGGGADPLRGGLDLSVAANLGLCAAVSAVAQRVGMAPNTALLLTLAAGGGVGALNAFAVIALRIFSLARHADDDEPMRWIRNGADAKHVRARERRTTRLSPRQRSIRRAAPCLRSARRRRAIHRADSLHTVRAAPARHRCPSGGGAGRWRTDQSLCRR
jgi:hypothetical protein